ncbi:DUF6278 family protein [Actinacidiphila paucisporea]|uniref:DUF3806 domain-containing protein n=1 Tax=Actinacidiphila paucisporea TaxID=310782 RepID=A0A1M7K1L0_9ACTN|nr:DUF6278 family protein [Actinacidiphila paucisporea]SHM59148.1 hypothetical protein SAMN05216499_112116 [Actinacidiphila paucisporea]
MDIPLISRWRKRRAMPSGFAVFGSPDPPDPAMLAELLGECPLLRARAADDGVELDDTAASLSALDQLVPNWRDEEEQALDRLGNGAGLYLGTVIVRTVPGARWDVWPNGRPIVRLATGREIDTVELGHTWAENGSPELSQALAETSED